MTAPPRLAVLGTDTGVGKTVVAGAVVLALRHAGIAAVPFKPVASGGVRRGGADRVSADAVWWRRALDLPDAVERLNPACSRLPLAPWVASRLEGRPLAWGAVRSAWDALGRTGRVVVVEGVGGVLVPLTRRLTVADLAARLRLPVLLVARPGIGTINHTLLSVEALRRRGVRVAGIVLNGARGRGLAERTNPGVLRALARVGLVVVLPHLRGVRTDRGALRRLARRLPARRLAAIAGGRA